MWCCRSHATEIAFVRLLDDHVCELELGIFSQSINSILTLKQPLMNNQQGPPQPVRDHANSAAAAAAHACSMAVNESQTVSLAQLSQTVEQVQVCCCLFGLHAWRYGQLCQSVHRLAQHRLCLLMMRKRRHELSRRLKELRKTRITSSTRIYNDPKAIVQANQASTFELWAVNAWVTSQSAVHVEMKQSQSTRLLVFICKNGTDSVLFVTGWKR